ncbi:MAG TPA: molybdopterin-dependent oxidoreductase [Planctomycetota bacterium]|nr:molybdopterin-dependent oxidoreductase [Planctomycetota bacterium]
MTALQGNDASPAPDRSPAGDRSRRGFLRLSAALVAASAAQACAGAPGGRGGQREPASKEESLAVWKRGAGTPYEVGDVHMPGVCKLPGPNRKVRFPDPDKYRGTTQIHGMCQLCSTVCGITGHVKDGRIVKIEGNRKDPNSRGKLCARGQAALNHQYHPERLLHPMKRVGARGENKWRRITWAEAYDELAGRLKAVRESGKPEEFAFHQGRNRSPDAVNRFLQAFGTNTALNHRGLCSAGRRAAALTYLFESDWDLGDYEHSKYILNFGSNMFEAHQGHVCGAQRVQRGRFENGAKLVTFDVRMSNTAGNSDEFFMPAPGTDGAVALAMAHTIVNEKLHDATFFGDWANCPIEDLSKQIESYTPEWAEQVSSIPAAVIRRIAREFAAAAPACTTMCNRGSSAHINGWYNDRAIILLNVLVGSVGKPGGLCWMWTGATDAKRFPTPAMPPKPKTPSLLADPPEFVLSNVWNAMKVGEIVYHYLAQDRARIQVYMTYNLDSPMTWPEMNVTRNVLLDEQKIGFHVCINPFLNETASFADMVLPWTTFMERWDVDARGAYNLKPYLGLRQPMVAPLGEAKDVREIFAELAVRIGGGMEQWYPEGTDVRAYVEKWLANVPTAGTSYATPMSRLQGDGAFEDPGEKPYYEPHLVPLSAVELEGSATDPATGIITKDGKGIGIVHRGKPVVGFKTPSRKLEVRTQFVAKLGRNEDVTALAALANSKGKNRAAHHKGHEYELPEMPTYKQIDEHVQLAADELIMTSFKWNVHNHGRTANLKWLSEIVHSNPAWIHPDTAARLGLGDGDFVELVGRRSLTIDRMAPKLGLGSGEVEGSLRLPVVVTRGVHPKAIAISNSLGHFAYTSVAMGQKQRDLGGEGAGYENAAMRDADWERNMWWEDRSQGDPKKWVRNTGNGWAQNHVLPIMPDPISGQQAFNDTVVRVRKVT